MDHERFLRPGTPLLVVGAGRGGTSLTAALLDGHPDIEMAFEFGADLLIDSGGPGAANRRAEALRQACEAEFAASSARLWGNKLTTEQLAALVPVDGAASVPLTPEAAGVVADFFLDTFRRWKVVFVVRSGPACIMSKVRRAGLDPDTAARRWMFSIGCMQVLVGRHPNLHVLHFEDLVMRPETTLTAVCGFLGVEFTPVMLRATTSPKLLPEYRRDGVDAAAAEPVDVSAAIAEQIAPSMAMAGYLSDGRRAAVGPPDPGMEQ